MSDAIKQKRDAIDVIDSELLRLVNARAELALEIGTLKADGIVYRPEREAQVLRRLTEINCGPLTEVAIASIFRSIMASCRALEKGLIVAFLGPLGTFSEEASLKQFGIHTSAQPCQSIDEVFRQVESGNANYGVVPVENSSEGAINRTLDLLLQSSLRISGEVQLAIHHNLMINNKDNDGLLTLEQTLQSIRCVYAHSQSLAQCHGWLQQHLPSAVKQAVISNSEAAKLARQEPHSAALASLRAANLFGLTVLAENVEDSTQNTTRFLVLSAYAVARSGQDKTSLAMTAKNQPGAVVRLLEPLYKHGVSMTKLESRPSKLGLWDYVFFVDIEGHQDDDNVRLALTECAQYASSLKVLGSYPMAML